MKNKKPYKTLLIMKFNRLLIILIASFWPLMGYMQPPPPPPGGGSDPPGGGAPVPDSLILFIAMALIYSLIKLYYIKKTAEKTI